MGDGPDGGLIAQARQQAPEHHLKVTAFPLDRSVRRLIQHTPQIFIAFGGATAVVRFGTFVFPGTGSHPRGQLCRRGERAALPAYFRDDLLSRVTGSKTGEVKPFEAVLRVKVARGVPVETEL